MGSTPTLAVPKLEGARNIMVGWISPGDVTAAMAKSLVDTLISDPDHRITNSVALQSSPRIVEARTQLVQCFLELSRCDWLLTIDADMAWEFPDFDKLCRAADPKRRPIIGGLCFAGGRIGPDGPLNVNPTLYKVWTADDGQLESETMTDYPRDRVVEVGGTGAAYMLIHRSVLTTMAEKFHPHPYPWYAESFIRGRPVGEDLTFCIRAGACGFKVFVHTGVRIAHEKRYYLTEALYDDHRRSAQRAGAGAAESLQPAAV